MFAAALNALVCCLRAALGYLHTKNLSFFNLSPDFLFIDADGNIQIMDFMLVSPGFAVLPCCSALAHF